MKFILLLVMCHLSLLMFSQVKIGRPWTIECGVSKNIFFKKSPSPNFRYISPAFRWSEAELTAEDEKHPETFKDIRLMAELIYMPPLRTLCAGFNVQCRFLKYKRLSLEVYGGPKFFFIPGPDFPLKEGKEAWYFNVALLCQLNLGVIAPFADIGYDGIVTVGTEVNFHSIYRKPKKRYKLRT